MEGGLLAGLSGQAADYHREPPGLSTDLCEWCCSELPSISFFRAQPLGATLIWEAWWGLLRHAFCKHKLVRWTAAGQEGSSQFEREPASTQRFRWKPSTPEFKWNGSNKRENICGRGRKSSFCGDFSGVVSRVTCSCGLEVIDTEDSQEHSVSWLTYQR